MSRKITVSNLDEQSENGEVYFKLDPVNTCKQLEISALSNKLLLESCMEFSQNLLKEMHQQDKEPVQLPFILDWKWVLGPQLEFIEIGWCFLFAEDHRWEWTKSFCSIAFDPSGTLSFSKWLPTDSHTIYIICRL